MPGTGLSLPLIVRGVSWRERNAAGLVGRTVWCLRRNNAGVQLHQPCGKVEFIDQRQHGAIGLRLKDPGEDPPADPSGSNS